jgi:predicted TIM-barrel fold metal-dependent hydrolase
MPKGAHDHTVVDFGAHVYPPEVAPASENDPDSEIYDIIGPVFTDPELAAERFAAGGVDAAVLSQPFYMGHGDVDAVVEANDALLDVVESYDRYYGLAAIPVAAGGEAAAAEFDRCLEAGYHGGALETMSGGYQLDDAELEPVFAVAEEHGAPLMVHPKLDDSLRPADNDDDWTVLDDKYRLNAIFGREAALCESICRVVHEGVLDEFEDLNLVFHHLGGNVAAMMGRIHLHLDPGRWPNQDAMKTFEAFKRQFEERVYIDTAGFFGYPAPVRVALEELPSTQVLYGTDSPAEPRTPEEFHEFTGAVVDSCSDSDAARVLGRNTLELLANVE